MRIRPSAILNKKVFLPPKVQIFLTKNSMDNMKLWDQVKVTDPSAVKKITGKSYQGNSPKPYWLIQRATEVFGPIGVGWGVTVESERFERISENDVLHVAVVSVWYTVEGKRTATFDQMGGTKACYITSAGKLMVDEDAGKKSVTDGMVKCLSMIGFAGDIFSGQWDDSKYVEWAAAETERRVNPPIDYVTAINQSQDIDTLKSHFKAAWKMSPKDDHPWLKICYDKRTLELTRKEETK